MWCAKSMVNHAFHINSQLKSDPSKLCMWSSYVCTLLSCKQNFKNLKQGLQNAMKLYATKIDFIDAETTRNSALAEKHSALCKNLCNWPCRGWRVHNYGHSILQAGLFFIEKTMKFPVQMVNKVVSPSPINEMPNRYCLESNCLIIQWLVSWMGIWWWFLSLWRAVDRLQLDLHRKADTLMWCSLVVGLWHEYAKCLPHTQPYRKRLGRCTILYWTSLTKCQAASLYRKIQPQRIHLTSSTF